MDSSTSCLRTRGDRHLAPRRSILLRTGPARPMTKTAVQCSSGSSCASPPVKCDCKEDYSCGSAPDRSSGCVGQPCSWTARHGSGECTDCGRTQSPRRRNCPQASDCGATAGSKSTCACLYMAQKDCSVRNSMGVSRCPKWQRE